MRRFIFAVLYTALALSANPGNAGNPLEALRQGDMKKLMFHDTAQQVSQTGFVDETGNPHHLGDFEGKYILLNFWATWCAPCRKEMPALNRLETRLGGDRFQVVTVATGRNSVAGIRRFFEENNVDALPQYRDPKQALARDMAVLGLPISVILNPDGKEIARLRGDATWDSDSAISIFTALIAGQG